MTDVIVPDGTALPSLAEEVAEKLRESMAKHRQAQPRHFPGNPWAGPGRQAVPKRRQWAEAVPLWREAQRLRQEAHDLDPHHEALAWKDEQAEASPGHDTHAELMQFYGVMLSRADA